MQAPNRLAIIGPSGSGKTTLGRWVQRALGLPFTDLDNLHWHPGWQPAPLQAFRDAVDAVTRGPHWVIAGNYAPVRDLIWPRADAVVWLDLPLPTVLRRSTARALRQWWTGEPICNGNRQTLAQMLIGRDALLPYTLRTFGERRRTWPRLLALQPQATLYRLTTPAAVAHWQASLGASAVPHGSSDPLYLNDPRRQ